MFNDCAFVGETLIRYLPSDIEVLHFKRTRRSLDKTFGITWRILKASGDVYHVNYLLQDCYLALKFGKHPLIGHAHGSDLREVINSKKWGRFIRYNLRNCDKILVAQPTILEIAKKFNETAEYFPIPFDPKFFYQKKLPKERKIKQVFLASSHDFQVKGTDKFLHALASVKTNIKVKSISLGKDVEKARKLAKELGIRIEFVEKVPHNLMNEFYWESDLVLGSFGIGQLDTVAIEAMACGRPVVHSIKKEYFPSCPLDGYNDIEGVKKEIELLCDRDNAENRVKQQLDYVIPTHSAEVLAKRLALLYSEVFSK